MTGEWVAIAVLGKPRGNRGELTAISLSDTPERFSDLKSVTILQAATESEFGVEEVWWHQGTLIFKFAGVDSINDAGKLTGGEVRVPLTERVVLEPGDYFHSDLAGCKVRERATGRELGVVASLLDSGGPALLELQTGELIPFARGICVVIDIAKREILVDLPDGLLELNRP